MNTLFRIVTNGAGAIVVTAGLGLVMANLIKVEFAPQQEKPEALSFVINEAIAEPPIIPIKPPQQKDIIIPPAVPKIRTAITDAVQQDWPDFGHTIPPITYPDIEIAASIVRFDQTPTPIVRIAPQMPARAARSGHCEMQFDISAQGQPYNIRTLYCSQNLFARASVKSVQGWKYRPEIRNGQAVSHANIRTTITFEIKDERGIIIPE